MSVKTKKAQVVVAMFDQSGQIPEFLLLQTNERRGEFWQNVTGTVEEDETFEAAGLREAMEETGLIIEDIQDILNLDLTYEFIDQHKRNVTEETFLIVTDKKWEIKIDPMEHKSFRWIKMNEISEDIVKFYSNYEALLRAQKLMKFWGV